MGDGAAAWRTIERHAERPPLAQAVRGRARSAGPAGDRAGGAALRFLQDASRPRADRRLHRTRRGDGLRRRKRGRAVRGRGGEQSDRGPRRRASRRARSGRARERRVRPLAARPHARADRRDRGGRVRTDPPDPAHRHRRIGAGARSCWSMRSAATPGATRSRSSPISTARRWRRRSRGSIPARR